MTPQKTTTFLISRLLIVSLVVWGCAATTPKTITIQHKPPVDTIDTSSLMAGAAKKDITPPIGLPMAGYSLLSTDSIGFRTKLYARAIYLKPQSGPPVALVQCDLLSGSLILHHRVAEMIADSTDVDAGGLLIAATHTHSGPGNYYANMFYNNMAANRSGFDEQVFEFLSRQLADAIITAFKNQRPARIATGTTTVTGVARNRSLPAYLKNTNISSLRNKPDIHDAVNPYLHMIRVDCLDDDGKYKPIGAFTNFSLHPNTNPAELGNVYNGDIYAWAEREVEWAIMHRYQPSWEPVHAMANYTHGDNNPDYAQDVVENFNDLKNFGNIIARRAFQLFISLDESLSSDAVIQYQAKEIDLFQEDTIDGISIAKRPMVGMAMAAGAQGRGRPSFAVHLPFFAPGWPRWFFTKGDHSYKRHALGPFQRLMFTKDDFPHLLFLQVIQIGDTMLIPLPFEVTYEMGTRIADKARRSGEQTGLTCVRRFIVVSTSNGYGGYVNTSEEYTLQFYEGGSNLYGPNTGNFLAAHIEQLTAAVSTKGSGSRLPPAWKFQMANIHFVKKEPISDITPFYSSKPVYHVGSDRVEPFWCVEWHDVPASGMILNRKVVRIEVSADGRSWAPLIQNSVPVDDSGCDLAIICLKKRTKNNSGLYEARWYNPQKERDSLYRFAVYSGSDNTILYSSSF